MRCEAGDYRLALGAVRDARRSCGDVLHLVQMLARADSGSAPRLWLVTKGAQQVPNIQTPLQVAQAPLWGLGRTIAAEHASFWGGLVDIDGAAEADTIASALVSEILDAGNEDQVAIRGDQRFVARLAGSADVTARRREFAWRPDAAYLITGGFGGIGLEVAGSMARQGARRLILLSRGRLPPTTSPGRNEPNRRIGKASCDGLLRTVSVSRAVFCIRSWRTT